MSDTENDIVNNIIAKHPTKTSTKTSTKKPSSITNIEKARQARKIKMQERLKKKQEEQPESDEEEVITFNFGSKTTKQKYVEKPVVKEVVKEIIKEVEKPKVKDIKKEQLKQQLKEMQSKEAETLRKENDELRKLLFNKPVEPIKQVEIKKNSTQDLINAMSRKILNGD